MKRSIGLLLGCLLLIGVAGCGTPAPTPLPLVATLRPTVPPTVTLTPAPSWGEISFSTSLAPSAASAAPGLIFPAGTVRLYAFLPYQHLPAGARLEARWYLGDLLVWNERAEPPAGSGTLALESDYAPQGLTPGAYRLEVWRLGETVRSGHFIILAPAPTATLTTIPSATLTPTLTPTITPTPTPTATRTVTPTPTFTPDLPTRLRSAYRAAVYLVTPKDLGGEVRGSGGDHRRARVDRDPSAPGGRPLVGATL